MVIKANGIVHADENWSDKFYLNQGCLYQLVSGRKTCHLTDYFLLGNFANCEQWQTTSLCELILTAWLKKVILKYVPECWKWCLRENKISTFCSSACPWILLGGAWCNASVFQLNTPSIQITHLSHFLMTTLLCWIKINSKQQLLPPTKRIHDVT